MAGMIEFGVIGLILITVGVLVRKRKEQDIAFIVGGLFLLGYSWSINEQIFIILQVIFVIASAYSLYEQIWKKKIISSQRIFAFENFPTYNALNFLLFF